MRERHIRILVLASTAALAISRSTAQESYDVQDVQDEDGNTLLTIEQYPPMPPMPDTSVLRSFNDRTYFPPHERSYDPRPKANINNLKGRNTYNGKIKGQSQGKGRRPF